MLVVVYYCSTHHTQWYLIHTATIGQQILQRFDAVA